MTRGRAPTLQAKTPAPSEAVCYEHLMLFMSQIYFNISSASYFYILLNTDEVNQLIFVYDSFKIVLKCDIIVRPGL